MFRLSKALLVLLGVSLAAYSVGYAITSSYKQLVGVGNTTFHREVDVPDTNILGNGSVKVTVESTADTEADYAYTVTLFLDGDPVAPTQEVSFTAAQIPGIKKKLTFTGLSLGAVTNITAEVTR